MSTYKKTLMSLGVIFLMANINYLVAQCSDAGICQIGGHIEMDESAKLNFGASYSFGYSGKSDDITYNSVNLSAGYYLTENTKANLLLPYNTQTGPLGSVSGIGNLIVGIGHTFTLGSSNFTATLGAKIATGNENKNNELPQWYQSSLGSTDFLFGLDHTFDKFLIGVGYQLAGKRNNNSITRLKRGDDFLLRGSYLFLWDDFSINTQLLVINRIGKSTILDVTSTEESFVEIENSDQLQIDLLVHGTYKISKSYMIFVEAAVPFLAREVNVDGLTRAFNVSAGFHFRI